MMINHFHCRWKKWLKQWKQLCNLGESQFYCCTERIMRLSPCFHTWGMFWIFVSFFWCLSDRWGLKAILYLLFLFNISSKKSLSSNIKQTTSDCWPCTHFKSDTLFYTWWFGFIFMSAFFTQSGFIAWEKPNPYRKLIFRRCGLLDGILAAGLNTRSGGCDGGLNFNKSRWRSCDFPHVGVGCQDNRVPVHIGGEVIWLDCAVIRGSSSLFLSGERRHGTQKHCEPLI